MGVGAFVIGLSQISSFLSLIEQLPYSTVVPGGVAPYDVPFSLMSNDFLKLDHKH